MLTQQSKDNFVHVHADMRIGGEFEDQNGTAYSFMRRKGRNSTLYYTNCGPDIPSTDKPVPPEIEALLTYGLTKEAYDSMFGLDHRRLREGGQALLKGEGDVGAALFEASAGVRSIPEVLERLEASTRKFFVPGARGKNARINEGLAAFDAHHEEYRNAQVRPAQWTELFDRRQEAAAALSQLEARRREVGEKLAVTKELRAVIPLLRALDSSSHTLEELAPTLLLPLTAPTDRAAAETGLSDALSNALIASNELTKQTQRIAELIPDTVMLSLAPAVRRLAAAAEAVDQHRRDIAGAKTEVDHTAADVAAHAGRIAATLPVAEVIERAPSQTARTVIEQKLRKLESATLSLENHRKSAPQDHDNQRDAIPELPSPEAKTALTIAQQEVDRSEVVLKRLADLPGEIKAAERAAAQVLNAIGLVDESAVSRTRPFLDADIDTALKEENASTTQRVGFEQRIADITRGLSEATRVRDGLLSLGVVPTREDVNEARSQRDSDWTRIRRRYIDEITPHMKLVDEATGLPEAYELAVEKADDLVDALGSDQERAAQLQAANDNIRTLSHDRIALEDLVQEADRKDSVRRTAWNVRLESAGLPALAPAALREWQARLSKARQLLEELQKKRDELERVRTVELGLITRLRAAIVCTALASPSEQAPLSTLSATAVEVAALIRQRETDLQRTAAEAKERDRQKRQWGSREAVLQSELGLAQDAAGRIWNDILLPDRVDVSVARSRVAEFDALAAAQLKHLAAQDKQRRAEHALAVLAMDAKSIQESLGDPDIADLRIYIDSVSARLEAAEDTHKRYLLIQQAADTARSNQESHEVTASKHRQRLADLCRAAQVDNPSLLPEAEERSRRKRSAQEIVDISRAQLAQASRRPENELRSLLAGRELAQMDADEDAFATELAAVQEALPSVRERDVEAKRALEAVDSSDTAAEAREAMENAAATVRNNLAPWIRSKIAHALLAEALRRFRDRAQGPMLTAASQYFGRMTRNGFTRLISDDSRKEPVLVAERRDGSKIHVDEMSEGTRDQLYLALKLAALDIRRSAGVDLPVVLDDVLMTSDEERAAAALETLADFGRSNQVIVFTHHRHVAELARQQIAAERLTIVEL
jgi:DNA repair protein SbcC/Rad50